MLLPKKTKFRKHHRGRRRGESTGQTVVAFGEYGIKSRTGRSRRPGSR
jgi:large subunit ribosomal protein L16